VSRYAAYDDEVCFHWDHLAGCLIVACITVLAIVFDNVVWFYDTALETERLLTALLLDRAPFAELFDTAPPGQVLIAFFVFVGDSAVDRVLPEAKITHGIMRVIAAAGVSYVCLSALIKESHWSSQNVPRFYSISFSFLVALGPFALVLSQVGVSTMLSLAIAAPLLRILFALDNQSDRVGIFEPVFFLIIAAFAGWAGILLALLISAGCLLQSVACRAYDGVLISGFTLVLGFGISIVIFEWAPDWPAPARTLAISHVVLSMCLPFVVISIPLLLPCLSCEKEDFRRFILPIISVLIIVAIAVTTGGNLLVVVAVLLLAYFTMWALIIPSFIHARSDPYYRRSETIWPIIAWLIGPIAVIATYALSAIVVWNIRTIVFSLLFWTLCLIALAIFLRLQRNQGGSRWALILTSFATVLFVGGVTSVPMREVYAPTPLVLAQQIWSLCRAGGTPPATAQVSTGIDPLTQRRLGPARRGPTDGVDVLYIRSADAPVSENAIELVQMRQPGRYIAAIAAPSEAARARCGRD
jgi:hypothetical protein